MQIRIDEIGKKFIKNISWTIMTKAVAMVCFFALDIAMARFLGKDSYGEWSFFYSAVIILAHLCWFGIDASVKVYVSKQETRQELSECLRTGLILRLLISTVFLIGVTACSGYLADYLEDYSKYENLHVLMCGAGALIFLSSFSEFYKALSIGMQRYRNLFLVTLMEYGGYLVCSVVGVLLLKDTTGLLAGYVAAGVFTMAFGTFLIRGDIRTKVLAGERRSNLWKEIFLYALPLLVVSMGEILLAESDTFFLGIFSIPAQVSMYAIGKKLCNKLHHVNYTFCITVLPQFSVINEGNYREKAKQFKQYALLNILGAAGVALVLVVMSDFLIGFLYGSEYQGAAFVFRLLLFYYVLHAVSYYFALFLEFQKKAVFSSVCYFVTVVLSVGLEVLLIPGYGSVGAAAATIVAYVPYTLLVMAKAVQVMRQYRKLYITENI